MSPDENIPTAENAVPKGVEEVIEPEQDAPLTQETFADQMQLLTNRARAAGLSPVHTLVRTYAKRGRIILESILGALESADSSKKKE